MTIAAQNPEPADAAARRAVQPVTVYTLGGLPPFDRTFYAADTSPHRRGKGLKDGKPSPRRRPPE